jgi:tetratricopeptide (TPR) repeat protein
VTSAEADLQAMLAQAQSLSPGPARWTALDAVFRHADAAENLAFGFHARLDTLWDLSEHGEAARLLLAFSWCLATFDQHPKVARKVDTLQLLWAYKWAIGQATDFPGIAMDQVNALIDDMQRRYTEGGHSLHAVYQRRAKLAHHLGDREAAEHWYAEMAVARRDDLSDCRACVPTGVVVHLVASGRDEEALALGAPYTDSSQCPSQPRSMIGQLLLAYLRTGRYDEAVARYRRAYGKPQDKRGWIDWIGRGLQFCALSGNEKHALPIVERHLPWLDRPASPADAMEFAVGAAQVLGRLEVAGRAQAPLARRSDDGTRRWESTIEQTRAELVALARGVAAEFDARNGNGHHSDRVEARLAAEPLVTYLPLKAPRGRGIPVPEGKKALDALARRAADLTAAGDGAGAARTQLELAYRLRNAAQWSDATEVAEEARRGLDSAGLVPDALAARYLLIELYQRGRGSTEIPALVAELLAAPSLPESVPSKALLLERTYMYLPEAARSDQLVRAADLYRDAGERGAEARCLGSALRWIVGPPPEITASVKVEPQASPATRSSELTASANSEPLASPAARSSGLTALVRRLDELVAAGLVEPANLSTVEDQLWWAQVATGDLAGALLRAERGGRPLMIQRAVRLLRAGHADAAEEFARAALPDADETERWLARIVVAASLRAQGRIVEAEAFITEHGIDAADLDLLG